MLRSKQLSKFFEVPPDEKMSKIQRRSFIAQMAAATAAGLSITAPAYAKSRFRLQLASTWAPKMPILQDAAELFASICEKASGGRLSIKVFAGGELIPPLEVFDAVSAGSIDMGVGASYYWGGKHPAAFLFTCTPFGFTSAQQYAWLQHSGQTLWEELYAKFNLIPLPFGNTGPQMAGWFKREISSFNDFKGLKIRIPGLGGRVLAQAGANVVLMPGSDLFTALDRGTIDAAEWVNPFHDERIGLYRAANFYYYPGWQEPSALLELTINRRSWENLPQELRLIIKSTAAQIDTWVHARFNEENGPALNRLITEHKVQLRKLPDDSLKELKQISSDVLSDLGKSDPLAGKVLLSIQEFRKIIAPWTEIGEEAQLLALKH